MIPQHMGFLHMGFLHMDSLHMDSLRPSFSLAGHNPTVCFDE